MATLHTDASLGEVAKVLLMPGDPVRAESIAKRFLHDVRIVSDVRGMKLYTGLTENNKTVSVMASGMGQPTIGIYAYELFKELGVELIIRVGTAGSFDQDVHVKDVLVATKCHTESNFAYQLNREEIFDIEADNEVIKITEEEISKTDFHYHKGTIYTNDAFYGETDEVRQKWAKEGYIGIEMEGFALYYTAKLLNKKALCLLTVSNHFINDEPGLTQDEKRHSMREMISLAVKVAERFAD